MINLIVSHCRTKYLLFFNLVWWILGSHQSLHLKEDDGEGDGSDEEVDDDHDCAEHDLVSCKLPRPVDAEQDDLKDDAEDVDEASNHHRINHAGLSKSPDETEVEHDIGEEVTLDININNIASLNK